MTLAIDNHMRLQGAVARGVVTGGAWLLGTTLLGLPALHPLVVGGGVLALGLATVPPRSWRSGMAAAALALGAAGVTLAGGPWLLAGAALAGMMYAREAESGKRRLLAAAGGALGLGLGSAVVFRLAGSELVATLSPGVTSLGAGAILGLFAGLGTAGREVVRLAAADPPSLPQLPALAGELGQLLGRAQRAFGDAAAALGPSDQDVAQAAGDLMGKIDRFAARWHELSVELGRADRTALAERRTEVAARAEAAKDDVVREEYRRAETALARQLEYLDHVERGRERALARLHHQVAVLERLRFAALHRRAVAAGRVGEELEPLVEELVAAGRDLDCEAEAIAELPVVGSA